MIRLTCSSQRTKILSGLASKDCPFPAFFGLQVLGEPDDTAKLLDHSNGAYCGHFKLSRHRRASVAS